MAAELFLRDGFAATSLERIAAAAGTSKRTLYARFDGKEAVFLAGVRQLIGGWLTGVVAAVDRAGTLETALLAAARRMLDVALTPEALALHRLVLSESGRFPGIAVALREGGSRSGIDSLCRILTAHRPALAATDAVFLAEQFQHLVLAGPQARAMGFGPPLTGRALDRWRRDTVALFLSGLGPAPDGAVAA